MDDDTDWEIEGYRNNYGKRSRLRLRSRTGSGPMTRKKSKIKDSNWKKK